VRRSHKSLDVAVPRQDLLAPRSTADDYPLEHRAFQESLEGRPQERSRAREGRASNEQSSRGGLLWRLLPAMRGSNKQLPGKGSKAPLEASGDIGDVEEGGVSGTTPLKRTKSRIGRL
jgi:hypothetical protein